MDLFIVTFESVVTLLGIGIILYWIIRKRIINATDLGLLSPHVLDVALPFLIFTMIVTVFSLKEFPDCWQRQISWHFFTLIVALLTFIFMVISKKEFRSEFGSSLFYQNALFFPLAINAGIYPSERKYLLYLFFFNLFFAEFFFSTYFIFFKKKQKLKIDIKKIFHHVLIVTVVVIFIVLLGIKQKIPYIIISISTLLATMTIPLIMIILGGNIYLDFNKKGKIQYFEIIKFVLIKKFFIPIYFYWDYYFNKINLNFSCCINFTYLKRSSTNYCITTCNRKNWRKQVNCESIHYFKFCNFFNINSNYDIFI